MSPIITPISTVSIGTGTAAATDANRSGSDSSTDQATTPSLAGYSPEFAAVGGLLLVVIALAAVVGNILVILSVYTNRKLRTITNLFVVSLAVADLMVGALVLPFAVKKQLTQSWNLGTAICDIWISLDVLLCTASILNLCCISIDRYFAITRPLVCATKRNRRHASVMIAAVWCLSAVITSPPLFGWKEENRSTDGRTCELTKDKGYVVYSAMGSFYIPLAIMIFVYVNIFVVARNAHRRWGSQTGRTVSLCSLIKETLPVSMKSPDFRPPGGGEERRKVLRVSTRSSSYAFPGCCGCCLGDIYWSEAVVADDDDDGDWRVSRGGRLPSHHVTGGSCSGQVEIVTCGDELWIKSGNPPSATLPATAAGTAATAAAAELGTAVTSPETETDNVFGDDVFSETKNTYGTVETTFSQPRSDVQCNDRSDASHTSMTFEERSSDRKINRRRHSFRDLRSCAHARAEPEAASSCSREGSSRKRKQFRRSESLPAHAPSETRDQNGDATTGASQECLVQKSSATAAATAACETEEDETNARRGSSPLTVHDSCETIATCPRRKRKKGSGSTGAAQPVPRSKDFLNSDAKATSTAATPFQRLRMKAAQRRENSTVLRERKTAKTVSIVVGCFVLCWLPFFIVYISEPFFADGTFDGTMKLLFVWLGYFNSVINPFIYAFYNHDFRFTFWRLTLGRFWGSRRLPRGVAPSSPNNVARFQSGQRERSVSGGEQNCRR